MEETVRYDLCWTCMYLFTSIKRIDKDSMTRSSRQSGNLQSPHGNDKLMLTLSSAKFICSNEEDIDWQILLI